MQPTPTQTPLPTILRAALRPRSRVLLLTLLACLGFSALGLEAARSINKTMHYYQANFWAGHADPDRKIYYDGRVNRNHGVNLFMSESVKPFLHNALSRFDMDTSLYAEAVCFSTVEEFNNLGHSTNMAGIIKNRFASKSTTNPMFMTYDEATGNYYGSTLYDLHGIAQAVRLMPVAPEQALLDLDSDRYYYPASRITSLSMAMVDYSFDRNLPVIVNMSFGNYDYDRRGYTRPGGIFKDPVTSFVEYVADHPAASKYTRYYPVYDSVYWDSDHLLLTPTFNGGHALDSFGLLSIEATSKNVITVGATDQGERLDYSSYGPTADLRIKPDICVDVGESCLMNFIAPDVHGGLFCVQGAEADDSATIARPGKTSAASAAMSGAAAVVAGHFYQVVGSSPHGFELKNLLLHCAANSDAVIARTQSEVNLETGYGTLDLRKAYLLLDKPAGAGGGNYIVGELAQGETAEFYIRSLPAPTVTNMMPGSAGGHNMRIDQTVISLCWYDPNKPDLTDGRGFPTGETNNPDGSALLNDLDVVVRDASTGEEIFFPYSVIERPGMSIESEGIHATRVVKDRRNSRDPFEKIIFSNQAQARDYIVSLRFNEAGHSRESQKYSLIVSGAEIVRQLKPFPGLSLEQLDEGPFAGEVSLIWLPMDGAPATAKLMRRAVPPEGSGGAEVVEELDTYYSIDLGGMIDIDESHSLYPGYTYHYWFESRTLSELVSMSEVVSFTHPPIDDLWEDLFEISYNHASRKIDFANCVYWLRQNYPVLDGAEITFYVESMHLADHTTPLPGGGTVTRIATTDSEYQTRIGDDKEARILYLYDFDLPTHQLLLSYAIVTEDDHGNPLSYTSNELAITAENPPTEFRSKRLDGDNYTSSIYAVFDNSSSNKIILWGEGGTTRERIKYDGRYYEMLKLQKDSTVSFYRGSDLFKGDDYLFVTIEAIFNSKCDASDKLTIQYRTDNMNQFKTLEPPVLSAEYMAAETGVSQRTNKLLSSGTIMIPPEQLSRHPNYEGLELKITNKCNKGNEIIKIVSITLKGSR